MQLGNNIGGILQAYALYCFIESKGHSPYLIRLSTDYLRSKEFARKCLELNPFYDFFDPKSVGRRHRNSKPLIEFVARAFLNQTKLIRSQKSFEQVANSFDAIIVGSDQVWRYAYVGKNIEKYFLKGVQSGVKKIAYAASFGTSEWECKDEFMNRELTRLVSLFDFVSVREESGLEILKDEFNYDKAQVCVDPTLLHTASFYIRMVDKYKEIGRTDAKEPFLFAYLLDINDHKKEFLEHLCATKGLEPKLSSSTYFSKSLNPAEWIDHIRDAEYILTDSFHGSVFSILFMKPFTLLINRSRGASRFATLLNLIKDKTVDPTNSIVTVRPTKNDQAKLLSLVVNSRALLEKQLSRI